MSRSRIFKLGFAATGAALMLSTAAWMAGCDSAKSSEPDPFEPGAVLALTYPKGGETFHVGDTITIHWKVKNNAPASIVVRLTTGNGDIWGYINSLNGSTATATPGTPDWDNFKWVIPDSANFFGTWHKIVNSDSLLLKIEDYDNPAEKQAQTKTNFKVLP